MSRRPPATVIAYIAAAAAVLIAAVVWSRGDATVLIVAVVTIPSLVALWLRVRAVRIGITILQAINLLRVVTLGAPVLGMAKQTQREDRPLRQPGVQRGRPRRPRRRRLLIGRNPADSSFTAGLSPEWAEWLASHARRAVSDKP